MNKEGKLIVVASQKGGAGKSTIATNLAVIASLKEHRVLLVDSDNQRSATKWYALRDSQIGELNQITLIEKSFKNMEVKGIWRDIAKFQDLYDLVIVDTPGEDVSFVNSLMKVADLVIIPMATGFYDYWGASDTVDTVMKLNEEMEEPIIARICLNQVSQTTSSRTTRNVATEEVHRQSVPLFATTLSKREIYAQSADGIGVFERYERELRVKTAAGGGKVSDDHSPVKTMRPAHDEIERLYGEVVEILKGAK